MADPIDGRMLASHRLGDDTVEPTSGPDALDVRGPPDAGEETVHRIAARDLISLSPEEREPLTVVDRLVMADSTTKHFDGNFL